MDNSMITGKKYLNNMRNSIKIEILKKNQIENLELKKKQ
jgi:hypothetical protein